MRIVEIHSDKAFSSFEDRARVMILEVREWDMRFGFENWKGDKLGNEEYLVDFLLLVDAELAGPHIYK